MSATRGRHSPMIRIAQVCVLVSLLVFLALLLQPAENPVQSTLPPLPPPLSYGRDSIAVEPGVETMVRGPLPLSTPSVHLEPGASPTVIPLPEPASTETPASASTTVMISVKDTRGELVENALVESPDCNIWRRAYDGQVTIRVEGFEQCSFRGGRRDGALVTWSGEVSVDMMASHTRLVSLMVPLERTAGMGLQIAENDRGIEVRRVIPGSPAEQAGLRVGDVVLRIDGQETVDLEVRDFVSLGTGPVGTQVSLDVLRIEGETERIQGVTMTRALIPE